MFCWKIFLEEDNAVASSHGNPSVPESRLLKHLAQTVEKQRGEAGFPNRVTSSCWGMNGKLWQNQSLARLLGLRLKKLRGPKNLNLGLYSALYHP